MLPKEDFLEEKACKERIRSVTGRFNVSLASLEDTETRRVRMRNQVNGDSTLTFDVLRKVAYSLPQVSCDWLLLGEGDMLRAEHVGSRIYTNTYHNEVSSSSTQIGPVNIGKGSTQHIRNREIEDREQIIAQQARRIAELERDKEMQRMIIESLTKAINQ